MSNFTNYNNTNENFLLLILKNIIMIFWILCQYINITNNQFIFDYKTGKQLILCISTFWINVATWHYTIDWTQWASSFTPLIICSIIFLIFHIVFFIR